MMGLLGLLDVSRPLLAGCCLFVCLLLFTGCAAPGSEGVVAPAPGGEGAVAPAAPGQIEAGGGEAPVEAAPGTTLVLGGLVVDDGRVQEAVLAAAPWADLADQFAPGNPIPVALWEGDVLLADVRETLYDPEQARALLAEAGYSEGLQLFVLFSPQLAPLAQEVSGHFQAIGMGGELVETSPAEALDTMTGLLVAGETVLWLRTGAPQVIGRPALPEEVAFLRSLVESAGLIPADTVDYDSAWVLPQPSGECCALIGAVTLEPVPVSDDDDDLEESMASPEAAGVVFIDREGAPYPSGLYVLVLSEDAENAEAFRLVDANREVFEPQEPVLVERQLLNLEEGVNAFRITESSPERCNWCPTRWTRLFGQNLCLCINC